ncbi:putative peroxisome assembly protein [Trypanosoma theileri]|uniref:Putative peroxisome assembly protein n=1 Tax=Trypanosoma theileri TaxID=67003 RepID=A0A1X0P610_9TRYP|nr:putative peroxisome assembly protein [Trypanosoma theileri]ORC92384.1 putative peroxisome assembly protein [Trypanosoma theileri]
MFESNLLSQINTASPLPTFVEVDLVNSINNSLSKAFHFVHVLLAEKSDTVASLLPWSSEIWLVLQTLLEHRLLFHANTTFAEMLFGLCRGAIASPTRPLPSQGKLSWWICGPAPIPSLEEQALQSPTSTALTEMKDSILDSPHSNFTATEMVASQDASYGYLRFRPLSETQRYISLFLITLKPYLQERAAMWYSEQLDSSPGAVSMRAAYANRYPLRARIKEILKRLYPLFRTVTASMGFLYQILFLLECTPYTAALHRVFGIAVHRLTMKDHRALSNPRAQRILILARVLFFLVFIGFRLLEFTGAGTGSNSVSNLIETDENLAVPQPPVWGVDVEVPAGARIPEPGICPVCERRVTNAAVCTVSGIVGCYPCLQSYTREHGACPVTSLKTSVDCIRRIYEC